MKAHAEAYGCTLNFGESREIDDLLVAVRRQSCELPSGCDLDVLTTCVVVQKTELAMSKRIRELSKSHCLIVTGCVARAYRVKAERLAPDAEFVGPGDTESFLSPVGPDATPTYLVGTKKGVA